MLDNVTESLREADSTTNRAADNAANNAPVAGGASELPKAYDPSLIEDKWAKRWVSEELFHVATPAPGDTRENFTILLPPPNVTGRLHMGHMFEQTETDVLIRWQRMRGKRALWVPGTDHAGIATQMLVDRKLTSEGVSRHAIGREKFLERVWEWKEQYGGAITSQMKRLGASVDWGREYFTMDARLSRAVREAFVRLHEQGLIYRGAYIVNWCPQCQTALSDLEVVHEEQAGHLWQIRYEAVDGSGAIVIATTRPETLLGDTAVAVNPADARYTHLHGKMLRLPLVGREIPLVLDDWADPAFGTGAVKVTPAHDPNDFEIGKRHSLPNINVMDESAVINENGGAYAGLDRFAARERILDDLAAAGQLVATKDHTHAVGRCDRCKTVVEPRLSTQWFVAVNKVPAGESAPQDGRSLRDRALAAVTEGHVKIGPDQHRKVYLEWMTNLHDWCISRQLWWGHRIPAWHCARCGETTVARETPDVCAHCGHAALAQETDVLDTWFSSGLLPFTVFGWPEHSRDLNVFYPTELLVTGFDILFFWVARMIMLGSHFMLAEPLVDGSARTLADAVPFREVHIHALVRDADRQKMSKTKGNVVDPISIIEKYGTDATRFTLAAMASPGTDIAFNEARTEGYRAFANKIWNAARFIFMQRDRAREAGVELSLPTVACAELEIPDDGTDQGRWITKELNFLLRFSDLSDFRESGFPISEASLVADGVNGSLERFRFDQAATAIFRFFWGDFCNWYVEHIKNLVDYSSRESATQTKRSLETMVAVFEASLRMLSPFMPFITEELWHALYGEATPQLSIACSPYPRMNHDLNGFLLQTRGHLYMNTVHRVIETLRAARKENLIPEGKVVPAEFASNRNLTVDAVQRHVALIQKLTKISVLRVADGSLAGEGVHRGFDFEVRIERQIDVPAERARLTKEIAGIEKEWNNNQRQLGNEGFLSKAPAKVVDGLRTRAAELAPMLDKARAALAALPAQE